MFKKSYPYLLALFTLASCNTKSTTESATQPADIIVATIPPEQQGKFLDLDVDQYQVYPEGDSNITLPPSDFVGVPQDREPDNLAKARGVKREGDKLIFTLKNGQQKVLTSELTEEENTVEYIFTRGLDAIDYWEVLAFYYESSDYVLINQVNGSVVHVWNKPVLSPDNKYVLCGSVDIEAGFIPNGFQLWSVEGDSLKLRWEKELQNWSAEKLIWTPDNHVWGEQMYRDNVSGDLKTRLIKMRMFWSDAE